MTTEIINKFKLEGRVVEVKPLGEGFINDPFIVRTEEGAPDYILQRKNHNVFPDVPAMMDNILKVNCVKNLLVLVRDMIFLL